MVSRKKGLLILILLLLLGSFTVYRNRCSTIEVSGMEIACYQKGGKEYILAKDLLLLGFEAVLEGDILLLDGTTQKPQASLQNEFPAVKPDRGLSVKLNGINMDYKNIRGEIAFCIDDLCALEFNPRKDTGHPAEYYTAFRQLGYSAYYFKRNADRSLSFLPFENSVSCNMGEIHFTGICENVAKSEMDGYPDLENLLRKMDAVYTFQNNRLDIHEAHFQRLSILLSDEVTNYPALRYPVLAAEIMTEDAQPIPAYIAKGKLRVDAAKFCEAYGYQIGRAQDENGRERIWIEK